LESIRFFAFFLLVGHWWHSTRACAAVTGFGKGINCARIVDASN